LGGSKCPIWQRFGKVWLIMPNLVENAKLGRILPNLVENANLGVNFGVNLLGENNCAQIFGR
jgi:hypothetical protein